MEKLLVSGCAGFIGMHLCKSLLQDGYDVYGIDNLNDYYDPKLKRNRLQQLLKYDKFKFYKNDISDLISLKDTFKIVKPDKVINLAAQAGVRYSLENPHAYINTNIVGFMNILDCCKRFSVKGLIYASSSSVYGGNKKMPFSVFDDVRNPISIYAATKFSNELMAKTYSHLYELNTTGLRFFTVYGPWGRPDMAMYLFTDAIINRKPISVFNNGEMYRDFTYIYDIVCGIKSSLNKNYRCEIFNLGNNKAEYLMDVIKIIEKELNREAIIKFLGMQPGDVQKTFADIEYTKENLNYSPLTSIKDGIPSFVDWYKGYYKK